MSDIPSYQIRTAASDADLEQILALQAANLPCALTAAERHSQGFVTLRHDLPLLREMNHPHPHIIATTTTPPPTLAAYALVMLPAFRGRLPLLDPMFDQLDRLEYRGRPLSAYRFYIMGQVCVAKPHRARGIIERMYAAHRTQMSPHFDLMITEIDRANPRSVRAHEKAGFDIIHEYRSDDGNQWLIVAMDLRQDASRILPP